MKERGISFKQASNEAARKGLRRETQKCSPRFVQKSFPLGQTQELRWDKALTTAGAMEDHEALPEAVAPYLILPDDDRLIYALNEEASSLTSDAHLFALAIERGAELCSSDHDFARFPGLKWRNPPA